MHLECVRIHVIYRVNQVKYVSHSLVVAPQEYVNIYSTRRAPTAVGQEVSMRSFDEGNHEGYASRLDIPRRLCKEL